MRDEGKTKKQLIGELAELRTRVAQLEASKVEGDAKQRRVGEAELRCQTLVDMSPDPIVVLQGDRYQFVSPAFTKVFGYTQEEINEGFSFLELVQDDDKEAVRRQYQDRLNGNQIPTTYRIDLVAKDGTLVPCETSAALIEHSGRPADLVIIRDITERDRVEKALQQSEERYRAVVEDQTELICRFGLDKTLTFVNEAYCRYFGTKRENLVGSSFMPLIPPSDRKKVNAHFDSLKPENPVLTHEHKVIGPNGKTRWQQWTNRAIFDKQGLIKEFQSVGRDITKRRQAEEALRKAHDELELKVKERTSELLEANEQLRREITNRKRMEKRLRESEGYMKSVLKAAPIGIGLVKNRLLEWLSDRMCEMLGYSEGELVGRSARVAYETEEEFERVGRVKYSQIHEGGMGTVETRFKRKDGSILDVMLCSSAVDPGDLSEGVIFTTLDITERKRAEEALRESERYFRSLLFSMHEDILVLERDYRITDVNNTLLVTVGRKHEEVVGRYCYDVSHGYKEPCHRKGEECMLREVFETGEPRSCRHQHVRANGSMVWVDILLSPLKDKSGNVTHVIEAIRDVSYLVEIEEELRESEENFRALAENANDGILIAAGEEGANVYANKRAAEITGYSIAELLEIGLYELVAPDRVKKVADRYTRSFMGKMVPSQYEASLVRKNGEILPAELSIARSVWRGEPASIVLIRDITERKRREEALRNREAELLEKSGRLEEVNAALKVLLKRREEDKEELAENVVSNVRELVFPYLEKLTKSQLGSRQSTIVDILQSNMEEIVSPFVTKLSSKFLNLTPTEIKIAGLIRDGRTTKDIAALLRLSENTIMFHRYNIRSKLRLKNKKVNLRSYLKSLH
jgi:PAS domain S-box-containing protein